MDRLAREPDRCAGQSLPWLESRVSGQPDRSHGEGGRHDGPVAGFAAQVSEYSLSDFAQAGGGLGWRFDPARAAVLVHDLLLYYVGVLPAETQRDLARQCGRVVDGARALGLPTIASAPRPATALGQRGLGGRLWGLGPSSAQATAHCLPDMDEPEVPWIRKRSLSAFFATDLDVELRRRGRDQLVLIGVFASQGIVATSFDALARDLEVFVIADAVADYRRDLHSLALDQVARSTGQVITTTEFVA